MRRVAAKHCPRTFGGDFDFGGDLGRSFSFDSGFFDSSLRLSGDFSLSLGLSGAAAANFASLLPFAFASAFAFAFAFAFALADELAVASASLFAASAGAGAVAGLFAAPPIGLRE